MKKIVLLLLAVMCCSGAYAKWDFIDRIEIDWVVGMNAPMGGYHSCDAKVGLSGNLELKYDFENNPWKCGLFYHIDKIRRTLPAQLVADSDADRRLRNRVISFGFLGEYNFRKGKNVNPFVSFAVGVAECKTKSDYRFASNSWTSAFMPRAGVEFVDLISLSAFASITRRGYNTYGIALGLRI